MAVPFLRQGIDRGGRSRSEGDRRREAHGDVRADAARFDGAFALRVPAAEFGDRRGGQGRVRHAARSDARLYDVLWHYEELTRAAPPAVCLLVVALGERLHEPQANQMGTYTWCF